MFSAALLCSAAAWTVWTVDDQLLHYHDIPFPSLPDYLFALQYPCFFLAILLTPRTPQAGPRLLMVLDGLLFLGAAAAFSWFFLLEPLVGQTRLAPLARGVALAYPLGDLLVLAGLALILLQPARYPAHRQAVAIVTAAVACLIVGDTLAVALALHPDHVFRRGALPDLFWMAAGMLVPLAALARRQVTPFVAAPSAPPARWAYRREDVLASLRFFLPLAAALAASAAILARALLMLEVIGPRGLFVRLAVSGGLLLLAVSRLEVMFLENARLQREREEAHTRVQEARVETRALRELHRRKDEFLGVVSHELKTPLASLRGYVELAMRRLGTWRPGEGEETTARRSALARTALTGADESVHRLSRLVDDLLDETRLRAGRLPFRPEPCDLVAVVRASVEAQRAAEPHRAICLNLPAGPVPVVADAARIGQVVANYLTNALKYSKEDRPVAVHLEMAVEGAGVEGAEGAGGVARVSVRDEGIGIPPDAQAAVWERYRRVEGAEVQSGSGIGLGLGLYHQQGDH